MAPNHIHGIIFKMIIIVWEGVFRAGLELALKHVNKRSNFECVPTLFSN